MQHTIPIMPDYYDVRIIDFETRRMEAAGQLHPALGKAMREMIRTAVDDRDLGMKNWIIEQLDAHDIESN